MDELSGIAQAIAKFGTQRALAEKMSERFGFPVAQSQVSDWSRTGYVPANHAYNLAKISGIAVDRLLRPKKLMNGRAAR